MPNRPPNAPMGCPICGTLLTPMGLERLPDGPGDAYVTVRGCPTCAQFKATGPRNWYVTRICCTTGHCLDCRGKTPEGMPREFVQSTALTQGRAEAIAAEWGPVYQAEAHEAPLSAAKGKEPNHGTAVDAATPEHSASHMASDA